VSEPDAPVIVARQVVRRYGKNAVVDGIDLDVYGGEILGLIGPNGGGKSTTLLLLAGLVRPTEGTVTVLGLPAHELATTRSGSIGLITADHGLYPLLTGWENLDFFGGLFGLSKAEVRTRATPLLEELGMLDALDRLATAYSSGMKQKLSLVRAQLLNPKVLLLDEPTANLDPVSANTIYEVVRREADRGLAVVLVTHDLRAAEGICDRVALIRQRVLHLEKQEGARKPPPVGRLFRIYQDLGEQTP